MKKKPFKFNIWSCSFHEAKAKKQGKKDKPQDSFHETKAKEQQGKK